MEILAVIETKSGKVQGYSENGVEVYKGIPRSPNPSPNSVVVLESMLSPELSELIRNPAIGLMKYENSRPLQSGNQREGASPFGCSALSSC